jgi:hypothetical protein
MLKNIKYKTKNLIFLFNLIKDFLFNTLRMFKYKQTFYIFHLMNQTYLNKKLIN